MGNAAGQGADGFHFLSLAQLFLQLDLTGYIALNTHEINDFPCRVFDRGNCCLRLIEGIIFFLIDESPPPDLAPFEAIPHLPDTPGLLVACSYFHFSRYPRSAFLPLFHPANIPDALSGFLAPVTIHLQ